MKLSQRQCFIILFAIVILLSALQLTVGGAQSIGGLRMR